MMPVTVILILQGLLLLVALIEPSCMKWLASRMLGWAVGMEDFRRSRRSATAEWAQHLGVRRD